MEEKSLDEQLDDILNGPLGQKLRHVHELKSKSYKAKIWANYEDAEKRRTIQRTKTLIDKNCKVLPLKELSAITICRQFKNSLKENLACSNRKTLITPHCPGPMCQTVFDSNNRPICERCTFIKWIKQYPLPKTLQDYSKDIQRNCWCGWYSHPVLSQQELEVEVSWDSEDSEFEELESVSSVSEIGFDSEQESFPSEDESQDSEEWETLDEEEEENS